MEHRRASILFIRTPEKKMKKKVLKPRHNAKGKNTRTYIVSELNGNRIRALYTHIRLVILLQL